MCYLRMFLQKNAMHVAVPQEKGRSAVHSEKAKNTLQCHAFFRLLPCRASELPLQHARTTAFGVLCCWKGIAVVERCVLGGISNKCFYAFLMLKCYMLWHYVLMILALGQKITCICVLDHWQFAAAHSQRYLWLRMIFMMTLSHRTGGRSGMDYDDRTHSLIRNRVSRLRKACCAVMRL